MINKCMYVIRSTVAITERVGAEPRSRFCSADYSYCGPFKCFDRQGLPGGHLCHITSPKAFSRAVTEYLMAQP